MTGAKVFVGGRTGYASHCPHAIIVVSFKSYNSELDRAVAHLFAEDPADLALEYVREPLV